jgi:hypothetical protein
MSAPAGWERVRSLFHQAIQRPRSEWSGFLEQECAGDEALCCATRSAQTTPVDDPCEAGLPGCGNTRDESERCEHEDVHKCRIQHGRREEPINSGARSEPTGRPEVEDHVVH